MHNSDPLLHKTDQLTTTVLSHAAHKRKPQATKNVRKLVIVILFIIPFLNYVVTVRDAVTVRLPHRLH